MQFLEASILSCREMALSCCQRVSGFSVPVALVKATICLSLFKDSSHTCPLRMAVRARPLACLRYSESCRVVGPLELMAVFSLQWRAMGESGPSPPAPTLWKRCEVTGVWGGAAGVCVGGGGGQHAGDKHALCSFLTLPPNASGKSLLGGGNIFMCLVLRKGRQMKVSTS